MAKSFRLTLQYFEWRVKQVSVKDWIMWAITVVLASITIWLIADEGLDRFFGGFVGI